MSWWMLATIQDIEPPHFLSDFPEFRSATGTKDAPCDTGLMATAPLFEPNGPSGFHYRDDFISAAEETALVTEIDQVTFAPNTTSWQASRSSHRVE
jgi:hypothetical protein